MFMIIFEREWSLWEREIKGWVLEVHRSVFFP